MIHVLEMNIVSQILSVTWKKILDVARKKKQGSLVGKQSMVSFTFLKVFPAFLLY